MNTLSALRGGRRRSGGESGEIDAGAAFGECESAEAAVVDSRPGLDISACLILSWNSVVRSDSFASTPHTEPTM